MIGSQGCHTVVAVGALLIGIGFVLLVFALGLAFTIYGEISAVAGVACLVTGIVKIARGRPRPGS